MTRINNIKPQDLNQIHITRKNINIGTALMDRPVVQENDIIGPEFCACYHLVGSGKYLDHNTGNTYAFAAGSLRMIKPSTAFSRFVDPGFHADKYIAIPGEYYTILEHMDLVSTDHPVIDLGMHQYIIAKYDSLIEEVQNQSELNLPQTINKAFSFITELLLPRPAVNQKWRMVMEDAAILLEKDFTDKITIAELATQANMSKTNFRRIFNQFFGVSPIAYRIQKKIEIIQKILSSEDVLMSEIAERFGYADVYTFSRQFKKFTGQTPSEFRKRLT